MTSHPAPDARVGGLPRRGATWAIHTAPPSSSTARSISWRSANSSPGHGLGRSDLLFVKVGTGISAGLCLDGRIDRRHGYAGDIGHVAVNGLPLDHLPVRHPPGSRRWPGAWPSHARGSGRPRRSQRIPCGRCSASEVAMSASHVASVPCAATRSATSWSRAAGTDRRDARDPIAGFNPFLVVVGGGVRRRADHHGGHPGGHRPTSRSLATESLTLARVRARQDGRVIGGARLPSRGSSPTTSSRPGSMWGRPSRRARGVRTGRDASTVPGLLAARRLAAGGSPAAAASMRTGRHDVDRRSSARPTGLRSTGYRATGEPCPVRRASMPRR